GSDTYQYDLDGFLTSKTIGADTTAYTYSSQGELLNVTLPDSRYIEYVHDPTGRRIAKKIDGVIIEKYLWAGKTTLLAIFDGNDNLTARFEYADGRMPVSMVKQGIKYYLIYDQVGSLRIISDNASNIVKQIDYDSFGNIITDTDPTFTIPFGFAGGLHDRDTNLVRFGYRDYDPDIGRWTAKDPILFAGGDSDLFGYCLSDPINAVDPEGLWTFQVGLSFTAGGLTGSTKGGGLIVGRNPVTGQWQFGWYAVGGAGLFVGAEASVALDLTWSGNPCIEDAGGWASTTGGSIGSPLGLGAGFESNTPLSGNANPSYTFSPDLSAGLPGEAHSFVTYTHVGRIW
ncbi:MAG: RHS repeat-associated core domain-containing protein, partial [Desulfobacteraceae bacterium]|nr:RHS repeat-associated core domain-containing protein [Desulfobacteraceae bacterium]